MNRASKAIIISLIFLSFFLFPLFTNSQMISFHENNSDFTLFIKSDPPITITHNDNFSTHANGGGAGTPEDPWIIQNLVINVSGLGHGISIKDTTDSFTIRNCTIVDIELTFSGIFLNNVSFGKITNNTVNNSMTNGISFWKSNYTEVSFSNFYNNEVVAIKCEYSSFNNITYNNFQTNEYGISLLFSSNNNSITSNQINDTISSTDAITVDTDFNFINNNTISNYNKGIYLQSSSSNNNVSQNIINKIGLHGIQIQSCPNNTIYNNSISECSLGISTNGENSTITSNLIYDNSNYGIQSFGANIEISNNIIHENSFDGIIIGWNYNEITNNTIYNNSQEGMLVNGDNNSIIGNRIFSNMYNGLNITGNKNNVTKNNITSNDLLGIQVSGNLNYFYRNIIAENYDGQPATQTHDEGIANVWDLNVMSYGADSDGDGITDYLEIFTYGTDATLFDTDNDDLSDGLELFYGTNPLVADSDGDGYLDGIEIGRGTNPLDPLDNPFTRDGITIIIIIVVVSIIAISVLLNVRLLRRVKKMEQEKIESTEKQVKSSGKANTDKKFGSKTAKVTLKDKRLKPSSKKDIPIKKDSRKS